MAEAYQPLVSIGLPVYNGAGSLELAIESLLAQEYRNIEIIISDNGSTDTTWEICAYYVAIDQRIRCYRSEMNYGSAWNFNRVFELSTGEYFMWSAHDDLRDPRFVSACVEKMECCPDAVLCQAHTITFISGHNEPLCVTTLDSFEGLSGLVARYKETLRSFPATALYGLYRSSAMRKTKLFRRLIATDIAFAQELSIHGRFVQVPEILFTYIGRERWNTIDDDYRIFTGRKRKPWWCLPFVALFVEHWQRVAASDLSVFYKFSLWAVLVNHEIGQIALKIFVRVVGSCFPKRWRNRLGRWIYRRWMLGRNVRIISEEFFVGRVIWPRLRW